MQRLAIAFLFAFSLSVGTASAQIVPPSAAQGGTRVPTLDETLINNLRATLPEQQTFVRKVVDETKTGKLDTGLVLAVMRYSQRRHQQFPFPFFERAIRHQAAKRGVPLPSVIVIASSSRTGLR